MKLINWIFTVQDSQNGEDFTKKVKAFNKYSFSIYQRRRRGLQNGSHTKEEYIENVKILKIAKCIKKKESVRHLPGYCP